MNYSKDKKPSSHGTYVSIDEIDNNTLICFGEKAEKRDGE